MTWMRRLFGVAGVSLAAIAFAGCTPAPPPPADLVGKTLEQTQDALPGPFIIVDITPNVVGQPASYNDGKDPSGWVVLVACKAESGEGYVVGVIPKPSETAAIEKSAKAGGFDSFVSGCTKK